ncbi:MAG: hypothetical protein AAFM91_18525 [Pseudomonadota bacterium]
MKLAAIVTTSLLVTAAAADELPPELAAVFDRMPSVDPTEWAYTQTVDDGESVTVRRFDPSSNRTWRLVSVDGRRPTDDELATHAEWVREQNDGDYLGENDFAGLAVAGSWSLTGEQDERRRYRFKPDVSDDDFLADHADRLGGELTLDTERQTVASFRLFNEKPFRARVVAKINKFDLAIDMQKVAAGTFFPSRVTTRIEGSALFRRLDSTVVTTYSDFSRRAPDAAANAEFVAD